MKLDKNNVENIIDLTPTQEGILFHYLYSENPHHYFEQTCLHMSGDLDKDVFNRSWEHVIRQNETLRTSFVWKKIKHPMQVILKRIEFKPTYMDLSALSAEAREVEIVKIKRQDKEESFDLQEVPFRIKVILISVDRFLLIISAHSILYDGWSFNIMLKEFFDTYHKLFRNERVTELRKPQFSDYLKLERTLPERGEQYWAEYLNACELREIPFKHRDTAGREGGLAVEVLKIPNESGVLIESLSGKHGFGVSSFFYAIWGILLQKICNENDVLFGTTFSGRSANLKGIENIVGNFLNTLPIRVKVQPNDQVITLIMAIYNDILTKQEYDQTSLFKIKEYARMAKQGDLFDSLVIFENHPVQQAVLTGGTLRIEKYSFEHASNYDLTIFILRSHDAAYEVHFAYNTGRFQQGAVASISNFFENLVNECLHNIAAPLNAVSVLSAEERNRIINTFNDTAAPYHAETNLKALLEAKGREYADCVAVTCAGQLITYDDLHKRCNRIAWDLKNAFSGEKICIGLVVDRSIEMVVSVLSVIKAGCTYVPIDPMLPDSRIKKMADNLSLQCIITTKSFESKIEAFINEVDSVEVLYTLGVRDCVKRKGVLEYMEVEGSCTENLPSVTHSEDIAYVIFTSGSTGMPKGVAVQHRPVINILEWINTTFSIDHNDKVLCAASLGFDLSVYDIFGTLAKGATLCVATFDELASPDLLMEKVVSEGITVWNSAPAVLQNLIQWNEARRSPLSGIHLRLVMLSGDWIGLQLPVKVRKYFKNAQVVSLGGATEAAIWSNYYLIDEVDPAWNSIPYGKPIQNCRYYVLDRNLDPCAIDVIGDLYIGGDCLALGYINDIALTIRKFISDPFTKKGRMYATGDLARWRNDGNMELIGRKDNQVKIRGYRIELGEIESHLVELPGVEQALAVVDTKESGEKFISAYYLGEKELDEAEARKSLAATLPSYMVPLHIIKIEELPVTANGKIDRKRLPKPDMTGADMEILQPGNAIQAAIISIWSEILNIPRQRIGVNSNFFELGGHSLNVTELTAKLANRYDINIQLRKVFAAATVEEQSAIVAKSLLKSNSGIPLAEKKEYYPLTSGQLRMFALHEMNKEGVTYNIAGSALIKGALDVLKVQRVFTRLVTIHESLRTTFKLAGGIVVQKIEDAADLKIEYAEITPAQLPGAVQQFVRPFNLQAAPLIRAGVFKYGNDEYCLVIDMHHIIADGYSLKKVISDFSVLYDDKADVAIPVLQFKDYTSYLNRDIHQVLLNSQKQYWKKVFSGGISRLNLPLDYPRPETLDHIGDKVHFGFDGEQFLALKTLAAEAQTTLFTVVLSMFKVLLAKVCNETDIVVATPSMGRNHNSVEHTVGMFVNTVVLRNSVSFDTTFLCLLKEVKEKVAEALYHDEVPFEYLAQTFDHEHGKNRNPVFDVFFEYDNLNLHNFELSGLEVSVMNDLVKRAKFDITFEAMEFNDRLECRFEYRTSLFKKETLQWLAERFSFLVSCILADKAALIGEINISNKEYLVEAEVIDFNF